jgi:hypothetical protein
MRKIHLEHCAKWEIRNTGDKFALIGIFRGEEAEQHAIGAAIHLHNSGVLDSKYKRQQPREFIFRLGADYEIRISDPSDLHVLWNFTRSRYPNIHNKIQEDTKGMFREITFPKTEPIEATASGHAAKELERQLKHPKQMGLFD